MIDQAKGYPVHFCSCLYATCYNKQQLLTVENIQYVTVQKSLDRELDFRAHLPVHDSLWAGLPLENLERVFPLPLLEESLSKLFPQC